jgi:DeoR/GlpR family transcriptional regulator of sugar metabolism
VYVECLGGTLRPLSQGFVGPLAHAAKLDHRPFHAWARLPLPWTLVTDPAADPRVTDQLRAKGVEVVIAGG